MLLRSLRAAGLGLPPGAAAAAAVEAAAVPWHTPRRCLASQVCGRVLVPRGWPVTSPLAGSGWALDRWPRARAPPPPPQADAECPHHAAAHAYLDSHRAHDTPTYRTGPDGRVQVAEPAARGAARQQLWAAAQRAAAGPTGPDTSALHDLCAEFGVADRAAFVRAAHRLPVERQHALFEHAGGVADLLQVGAMGAGQGVGRVARLRGVPTVHGQRSAGALQQQSAPWSAGSSAWDGVGTPPSPHTPCRAWASARSW